MFEECLKLHKDDADFKILDPLGMTPFHILISSSTKHNTNLLHSMLMAYPYYVHGLRDKFGKLDIDYLQSEYIDKSEQVSNLAVFSSVCHRSGHDTKD